MEDFWQYMKTLNDNYAQALTFIVTLFGALIAAYFYGVYKESQINKGDAASIVDAVFWTIGKKYKILAVHEFAIDNSPAGYQSLAQNSRPDQWAKLIKINSTFLGFRHEVIPVEEGKILKVIISRNGNEKWKVISFNAGNL